MAPRRLPNGRFAKVTLLPPAISRPSPRQGGGEVRISIRGQQESQKALQLLRTRVGTRILSDGDKRASAIQQRMRAAVEVAYNRAATGRVARGIFAKVTSKGRPGDEVQSVIRVTMLNYRETRFLTNIGGGGWFQRFPVPPYRIFAEGVESELNDLKPARRSNSMRSGRSAIRIVKGNGVGRLKVPRRSSFFTASRQPGRGGGESRSIGDILGPAGGGDRQGHFFFYPLWVNHPGFKADVIADIALEEGARFTSETTEGFAADHSFVSTDIPIVKATLRRA